MHIPTVKNLIPYLLNLNLVQVHSSQFNMQSHFSSGSVLNIPITTISLIPSHKTPYVQRLGSLGMRLITMVPG